MVYFLSPTKWTLKGQITAMISIMGCITLLCAVFIIYLYSEKMLNNHKYSLEELIEQEVKALQIENASMLEDIGLRMQFNPVFKKAYKNRDIDELTRLINDEFSQYYIATETIVINKINIFDKQFNLIASSTLGDDYNFGNKICTDMVSIAKSKKGIERVKPFDAYCSHDNHVFNSTILAIGALRPQGYVQILSDPIYFLKKAEIKLHMPLRIEKNNNQVVYESKKWGDHLNDSKLLLEHSIIDKDKIIMFKMSMYRDISNTNYNFSYTRNLIIIVVTLVTVLIILLFILIFNRVMLKPLFSLSRKFELIADDKKEMGIALPLEGSREIMHLTHRFNEMHIELAELYQSLERTAFTDHLTELPNRTKLQDLLVHHTSLNLKKNIPFTLFMMDLDKFKSVNDTLGHYAGDVLLQQVGSRLSSLVSKGDYISLITEQDSSLYDIDVIARLGGDEFAAIFPILKNPIDASAMADKIIAIMKEPFVLDGNTFTIGISIGIALCPIHGQSVDLLMKHADVAMYDAKNNKTGYSFYNAAIDQNRVDMLTLEDDLRNAVSNNELKLVYQPKIDLQTNKVIGVEALLRWTHVVHGAIPPDKFIIIAEQSSLINIITKWVITTALQQVKDWREKEIRLTMAINLSVRNLLCSDFLFHVDRETKRLEIEAKNIYFEITETSVMSNPERSIVVLEKLKAMGFRLSIDDFGTGYSSLIYLKKLPVDEIKIDRSFVMEMETNENDEIIVQSTIDLAHNMGLRVTAEGVESQTTLQKLKDKKSDYAQGYYICRPISSDEFERWLQEYQ